ncbi:MAG: hypothetical protein R3C03_16335 [Pirellulaceae bacterium]
MSLRLTTIVLCGLLLGLSVTTGLHAQLINSGQVYAYSGQQAPGFAPGVTFTNSFSQAVFLDGNNRVYVVGDVQGPGIVTDNDRGLFSGTPLSTLGLLVKEEDSVPGVANAIVKRTLTTSTNNGMPTSSYQTTAGNRFWMGMYFSDDGSSLSGITTGVNDDGLFTGTYSSGLSLAMRRGQSPRERLVRLSAPLWDRSAHKTLQ